MPSSMTGFARKEAQFNWGTIICEVRTVNHRYLEPFFRLPDPLRSIEPELREALKTKLNRGKAEISFQVKSDTNDTPQMDLNSELAKALSDMANSLKKELHSTAELNPLELLRWPGIIRTAEIDPDILENESKKIFKETLDVLVDNRQREGNELKKFILQRLNDVGEKVATVRTRLPEVLEQYKSKLKTKIESLKIELDQDRFNQEAIYIAQKADVAEELDRIDAHIQETKRTLDQKQPVGRRLDFLMQEFNRESNTLSSKSIASDVTQVAVDLKVLIEQMREQIQNLE